MAQISSDIVPYLPEDIEREIFQLTAAVYPDAATQLLQVATRIRSWIEPITHEVVIYHRTKVVPPQLSLESFARNAKYIRHLLIGGPDRNANKDLISRLPLCSHLVDLAIWTGDVRGVLEYLEDLRLQRLSISFRTLFGPGRNRFTKEEGLLPVFSDITHLEVITPCYWADECEGFTQLPQLTHLSIMPESGSDTTGYCLAECKNLKVLAVAEEIDPEGWALYGSCQAVPSSPHQDPRAVYFRLNCIDDWETHARGGRGMWARAEEDVLEQLKEVERIEAKARG
ncbi:hypothetical protein BDN72DRAFT_900394 [Pluteus cervinus]|uniref:Uncharacterized protein n=1 Tax=Pluteus cervinus TaxID=181527 RepID=A0ACD3AKR8_9AGAR|nr:hypothetical protein BDN72DRAFT_900394 [Pluteus cervinus]